MCGMCELEDAARAAIFAMQADVPTSGILFEAMGHMENKLGQIRREAFRVYQIAEHEILDRAALIYVLNAEEQDGIINPTFRAP